MGTANIALLLLLCGLSLLVLRGAPAVLGAFSWFFGIPGRTVRRVRAWNHDRRLRKEAVRKAQLENQILEERLRNETVRDFLSEKRKRSSGQEDA